MLEVGDGLLRHVSRRERLLLSRGKHGNERACPPQGLGSIAFRRRLMAIGGGCMLHSAFIPYFFTMSSIFRNSVSSCPFISLRDSDRVSTW